MPVRLSVNLNKVALIRNARGANFPNLIKFAQDCEEFGAEGITVHPRPDERHVRFSDLQPLKDIVSTEFNIEGNPTENFISQVLKVKPHQVTLVPDAPSALTSDAGWDTIRDGKILIPIIKRFQDEGIRVSLFIDPIKDLISQAKEIGTDRIEFYTGPFAKQFHVDKSLAIEKYISASRWAHDVELGINAGHDLNLDNLNYFVDKMPYLQEVSIGHALVVDALYYGIQNTIAMYLHKINKGN